MGKRMYRIKDSDIFELRVMKEHIFYLRELATERQDFDKVDILTHILSTLDTLIDKVADTKTLVDEDTVKTINKIKDAQDSIEYDYILNHK